MKSTGTTCLFVFDTAGVTGGGRLPATYHEAKLPEVSQARQSLERGELWVVEVQSQGPHTGRTGLEHG